MKSTICPIFTILLAVSSMCASQIRAQSFKFEAPDTIVRFDLDMTNIHQDVFVSGQVINYLDSTNLLYWTREEVFMPAGWESFVCDKTACYFPWTSEREMPYSAFDTGLLDLHLLPNGNPGDSAVIKLCVQEFEKPITKQCYHLIYKNTSYFSSTSDTQSKPTIEIFPNPSTGIFTIKSNDLIGYTRVYNTTGRCVQTIRENNGQRIDLTNMPDGIYYIQVLDESQAYPIRCLPIIKQ